MRPKPHTHQTAPYVHRQRQYSNRQDKRQKAVDSEFDYMDIRERKRSFLDSRCLFDGKEKGRLAEFLFEVVVIIHFEDERDGV